jgi:hypothetical protein
MDDFLGIPLCSKQKIKGNSLSLKQAKFLWGTSNEQKKQTLA